MKSLKRISKMQTKIKAVLSQMVSVVMVATVFAVAVTANMSADGPNHPPNIVLISPSDGDTVDSLIPALNVLVSDLDGDNVQVTFYGGFLPFKFTPTWGSGGVRTFDYAANENDLWVVKGDENVVRHYNLETRDYIDSFTIDTFPLNNNRFSGIAYLNGILYIVGFNSWGTPRDNTVYMYKPDGTKVGYNIHNFVSNLITGQLSTDFKYFYLEREGGWNRIIRLDYPNFDNPADLGVDDGRYHGKTIKIESISDIASDSNVIIKWKYLEIGKTYQWYAVVSDGIDTTTSSTRNFALVERVITPTGEDLVDDDTQLFVPPGDTYILYGEHIYTDTVNIQGNLFVAPYDGSSGYGELYLNARIIQIDGLISADGAGYRAGAVSSNGEGPGAGRYGGAGGGAGYGGKGGNNGYGLSVGGGTYGSSDDQSAFMGSGGGGGAHYPGGNGGGVISLKADTIIINGIITADGEHGGDGAGGQSGGGGSGGTIIIMNTNSTGKVEINGILSCHGGRGGRAHTTGGGGGGGRIKIFSNNYIVNGYCTVNGGSGGPGPYRGTPGWDGTIFYSITGTVDIDPDTLNLKSKGKWVTCYLELSEGYYVGDIEIDSVGLIKIDDDLLHPPLYTIGPSIIGDYDDDGILDLMVKFDRHELIPLLEVEDSELTVSGELIDGLMFEGSDTIRVIDKGGENK